MSVFTGGGWRPEWFSGTPDDEAASAAEREPDMTTTPFPSDKEEDVLPAYIRGVQDVLPGADSIEPQATMTADGAHFHPNRACYKDHDGTRPVPDVWDGIQKDDYDISPLDLDALRREHPLLIERFEADARRRCAGELSEANDYIRLLRHVVKGLLDASSTERWDAAADWARATLAASKP